MGFEPPMEYFNRETILKQVRIIDKPISFNIRSNLFLLPFYQTSYLSCNGHIFKVAFLFLLSELKFSFSRYFE